MKKWYFWGIVVIFIIMISGGSSKNNTSSVSNISNSRNLTTVSSRSINNQTTNTNVSVMNNSISNSSLVTNNRIANMENNITNTVSASTPVEELSSLETMSTAQEATEEVNKEPVIDTKSEMVWVGNTGTKYHYENCRTLKGKGHQITLKQALSEGKEACKVCH